MNNILTYTSMLKNTPTLLEELLAEIPVKQLKANRLHGQWSIHEHAVHVCLGERFSFHPRFQAFLEEESPVFEPISGDDFPDDFYLSCSLDESLQTFYTLREKTVAMITAADGSLFRKEAHHPEYRRYTPCIMSRHLLMHDHWHLYEIERLWLTRDAYL